MDLDFAVELFLPFQPGFQLRQFTLFRLKAEAARDVVAQGFLRASGQGQMMAQALIIQARKIQGHGKWKAGRGCSLPTVIEGSLDHPFRCICLAGTLVRGYVADFFRVVELKKNREWNSAINRLHDAAQAGLCDVCGLELQGEDLNFRNAIAGGQMQGLGRQFMRPDNLGDMRREKFLDALICRYGGMDAGLGNRFAKSCR